MPKHRRNAAVVSYPKSEIVSVRAEANSVFIRLEKGAGDGCSATRVWVPITSEDGRAKYSLALTAFARGSKVLIRAYPNNKLFSACQLYDIIAFK